MFFGLSKTAQSTLRRYLSQKPQYHPLIDEDKEAFHFNPDNLFLTEDERRPKNVIVIDQNSAILDQCIGIFKTDIDLVQVAGFDTYSSFLTTYLEEDFNPIDPQLLKFLSPSDFFEGQLKWAVDAETYSFNGFLPEQPDTAELIGYPLEDFRGDARFWKEFISKDKNASLIEEGLNQATLGQTFSCLLFLKSKENDLHGFDLKIKKVENQLEIELNLPPPQKIKDQLLRRARFTNWDLLVLDSKLVGQNVYSWIENLQNTARTKGFLKSDQQLKLLVLLSEDSPEKIERFKHPQIVGLCYKPIDNRLFLFNASMALQSKYTVYNWENLNWAEARIHAHVAKSAKLRKLSEFGAIIEHARPIAPGTFLFLRGSIFDQAPRKNLCARFYSCEEDPNDKEKFLCHLIYYGINEAFNKYARSWFRETYAASKSVE